MIQAMKLLNDFFRIEQSSQYGDNACHRIQLNPGHVIYQAHFPGNPITPGVCVIQIVGELLSELVGKRLVLSKVNNVKFLSTLSPAVEAAVDVTLSSITEHDGELKVKAIVKGEKEVYSKLSLTYYND